MPQKVEQPQIINITYGATDDGRVLMRFSIPTTSNVMTQQETEAMIGQLQEALKLARTGFQAPSTH